MTQHRTREASFTVNIPKGCDFVALRFGEEGFWEATAIAYTINDRHGNAIPSQLGMAFKARTPETAFARACEAARDKLYQIKRQRDAKPAPAEAVEIAKALEAMPKAKNKSVAKRQENELAELLGLVGK